ncbi:hypothetical protein P3G55_24515 [Leptospira sp. 96542]|nr:hypothetical protein [Leptospira sp. 96542]
MLIQLLIQHPEALPTVIRNTPPWVGGLAAGLAMLGASQLKDRQASLVRVSLMPLAMTGFSIWGTLSALAASPWLAQALGAWIAAAALVFILVVRLPSSARYDAASRTYAIPGSVVPLLLMLGIFLVKYGVGVDLAMAPQLMRDPSYALTVAGLYGAFTGLFVGRAARLWKLALPRRRVLVV